MKSKSRSSSLKAIALLITALPTAALAQQYPTTPYQGFGAANNQNWAVSPPSVPDAQVIPGFDDSDAMSPDSWSSPSTTIVPQQNFVPQNFVPQNFPQPQPALPAPRLQENLNLRPQQNQNLVAPKNDTSSTSDKASVFQPAGFPKETESSEPVNGTPSLSSERYPLDSGALQSQNYGTDPQAMMNSGSPYLGNHGFGSVGTMPVDPPAMAGPLPNSNMGSFNASQVPMQTIHNQGMFQQYPAIAPEQIISPVQMNSPVRYRPDLGHRTNMPTVRNFGTMDQGKKYDFEDKKKQYPPMSEILATGRYFGSIGFLGLEPHFQSNTAIAISNGANSNSQLFQFDLEGGPHARFGFESKYGPGIELSYFQVDGTSDNATFTSDGASLGETSTWMMGANRWSRLTASAAGDTINASHEIDVEVFGISFFKEVQLPISRINGRFGFQYAKIFQAMDATLSNGGATLGALNTTSNLEAYGPNLVLEYYRPVGHTKLEFITTFGASVLFGDRNQFVQNTVTGETSRIQANEFITAFDFFSGAQYKKNIAENRSYFARAGLAYSTWIGGGTANDPTGSFGLRGFSFTVGYNR